MKTNSMITESSISTERVGEDLFQITLGQYDFARLYTMAEDLIDLGGHLPFQDEINTALGEMIKANPKDADKYLDAMKFYNLMILKISENFEMAKDLESATSQAGHEANMW